LQPNPGLVSASFLVRIFLSIFSNDFFYIVPDKCTECKGFHDEPQCAAVCPVDCCVPDTDRVEDEATLLARKEKLDQLGR